MYLVIYISPMPLNIQMKNKDKNQTYKQTCKDMVLYVGFSQKCPTLA